MGGRYLLDTNIIIAALASDASVLDRIDDADECFVSIVVLGEMLYGAFNSNNVDSNLHRVRDFVDQVGALPCDEVTAELYGQIKTSLRQQGTPIPENDMTLLPSRMVTKNQVCLTIKQIRSTCRSNALSVNERAITNGVRVP